MKDETVYLKAGLNTKIYHTKVLLEDAVSLYGENKEVVKKLNHLVLIQIQEEKEQKYVFCIFKIMELIHKEYPGLKLENIGETDFVMDYTPPGKEKKWFIYVKTAAVCLITFFGSAFAIMTFNTDVNVSDVFGKFYYLVMGKESTQGSVLEITYSLGLLIGIVLFYNHFSAKKSQLDPTPIQVEMRNYEKEVGQSMVMTAEREEKTIDAN